MYSLLYILLQAIGKVKDTLHLVFLYSVIPEIQET